VKKKNFWGKRIRSTEKNPMTSGIEPVTIRLVAWRPNQLCYCMHWSSWW
jgi:hypothetical protein